jgi:hypothetical protein
MTLTRTPDYVKLIADEEITIDQALSLLTGADFHSILISGFSDFGWQCRLIDHEDHEYEGYHASLEFAIGEAWIKWRNHDPDTNPDAD